jgi:hypothetical protein
MRVQRTRSSPSALRSPLTRRPFGGGEGRMSGWVYVIEAKGQHLFKVGFTTTDPEDRLRQLQTGCPHKLELLTAFSCENPPQIEEALHQMLERHAHRVQGEWFALPREEMLDCMMHFFGGLAQATGIISFRSSSLR